MRLSSNAHHPIVGVLFGLLAIATLSGCASVTRSYDTELKTTLQHTQSGNIDQALASLESNNPDKDKDLLYYLEKGELTRLQNNYNTSRESLLKADEKIMVWEAEAKNNPEQLMGLVGSVLVNDKVMRYDGQDYEKVMASSKLALTHIALGDMDSARVEIKKTHEREAVIKEFRDKEYAEAEAEATEKGQKTSFKDLQGYPVETLNDPEVTSLKNGYQNAFSHYLAGFVYEAMNEPGLAAAGYRTAIELRPGLPLLEEGLAGLGKRGIQTSVTPPKKKRKKSLKSGDDSFVISNDGGVADVLFVIETGSIAGRESISIPIPVPTSGGVVLAPITFPVIRSTPSPSAPMSLKASTSSISPTKVANLDAMAQRCLSDEMPAIIMRSVVRAAVKGTLQKEAGRLGLAGQLVAMAATVATEGADERSWRSLPKDIYLARAPVPVGTQEVMLDGQRMSVEIKPGANVVNLRQMGGKLYLVQPNTPYIPPAPVVSANAPGSAPEATAQAESTQAPEKETTE